MGRDTVVNIGVQQFDEIREQGSFYIDKTGFINEWWERLRALRRDDEAA